ncbi:MAG: hypothetical protein AAGI25_02710 [Bacteroidota bacterium]
MESKKENSGISLNLSDEEALVLLNWVFRFNDGENDSFFEDQAEERVLWDIEAVLEKVTAEIFDGNYTELLAKARDKVRD